MEIDETRMKKDIGGQKMAERLVFAGELLEEFCSKYNKKLSDFEFCQIASEIGKTLFVRSEIGKG